MSLGFSHLKVYLLKVCSYKHGGEECGPSLLPDWPLFYFLSSHIHQNGLDMRPNLKSNCYENVYIPEESF